MDLKAALALAPPVEILQATTFAPLYLFVDVWLAMKAAGSGTITSWYRTRAHNASVGGEANSQHLIGTAIDVVGVPAPYLQSNLHFGEVVLDEGDHVHVQLYPAGTVAPLIAMLAR